MSNDNVVTNFIQNGDPLPLEFVQKCSKETKKKLRWYRSFYSMFEKDLREYNAKIDDFELFYAFKFKALNTVDTDLEKACMGGLEILKLAREHVFHCMANFLASAMQFS